MQAVRPSVAAHSSTASNETNKQHLLCHALITQRPAWPQAAHTVAPTQGADTNTACLYKAGDECGVELCQAACASWSVPAVQYTTTGIAAAANSSSDCNCPSADPQMPRSCRCCCQLFLQAQVRACAVCLRGRPWADRCHSQCLLCLLSSPGVHTHEQLSLLKDIPAEACCWGQLDQVGKQALQAHTAACSMPVNEQAYWGAPVSPEAMLGALCNTLSKPLMTCTSHDLFSCQDMWPSKQTQGRRS